MPERNGKSVLDGSSSGGRIDESEDARLLEQPTAAEVVAKQSPVLEGLKVLFYCGLYLSIGPTLILVNRSLLKRHSFDYPMMLSGLGLLFSSAVSVMLVRCGVVHLENSAMVTRTFFIRNLLPIGAAMATTLAAGNAVYLFLPVGLIQMLKAFTPGAMAAFLHATPRSSLHSLVYSFQLRHCDATLKHRVSTLQLYNVE